MSETGLLDHGIKDIKMIHYPDWKPVQKDKWIGIVIMFFQKDKKILINNIFFLFTISNEINNIQKDFDNKTSK